MSVPSSQLLFVRRIATLLFMLALVLPSAPTRAADPGVPVPTLQGVWNGRWKCTQFIGAKFASENKSSVVTITDGFGTQFGLLLDGLHYTGIHIPDDRRPTKGEAALVQCATNASFTPGGYDELGRFKWSIKDEKGSLTGTTFYSTGTEHVGTCKYRYKRVATTNPGVAVNCP